MADTGTTGATPPSAASFFIPHGHRLFGVFDDRSAAEAAVAALGVEATGPEAAWIFDGDEGARELDPEAAMEGWRSGYRLFAWLFSSNIEYLRGLSQAVREGNTVVAVHVASEHDADATARRLRRAGGRAFAYATHGNFVPLAP